MIPTEMLPMLPLTLCAPGHQLGYTKVIRGKTSYWTGCCSCGWHHDCSKKEDVRIAAYRHWQGVR
jgi:hypothetical protein